MTRLLPVVVGVLALFSSSYGQDSKPDLVVHEWGTFTAVVGSDGVQLEWRPLVDEDLPDFVHSRAKPGYTEALDPKLVFEKRRLTSYQRMETPVTYFYADREMEVDVRVDFPKGLLTEWYPRVREFGPLPSADGVPPKVEKGFLRWGRVKLIPPRAFKGTLPTGGMGDHYTFARDVDASYVRVCSKTQKRVPSEFERFLFYRGVSDFSQPITIRSGKDESVSIVNEGLEDVHHVFILHVDGDRANFASQEMVRASDSWKVDFGALKREARPKVDVIQEIEEEIFRRLVLEGLYQKEARAMVRTWSSSWFGEAGTRVLYLMPERLTHAILPLKVSPRPREMKRVMVGRVEWISPGQERRIQGLVRDLGSRAFQSREAAQSALESRGRFAEPMVRRAMETTDDPEIRARARQVLASYRPRR